MAKADMFLRLECNAWIRGEADVPGHLEEIEIQQWGWGMIGSSTVGVAASKKAAFSEISFCKGTDRSTPLLMQAMSNHADVNVATLTICKAGSSPPLKYLTIKVERGRINSLSIGNPVPGTPEIVERFSIVFEKITVTYAPQDEAGQGRAELEWEGEVSEGAR